MNEELQQFARKRILEDLRLCTDAEKNIFKRMYAKGKMETSIEEIVEKMDIDKLSWAMEQIKRTIKRKSS